MIELDAYQLAAVEHFEGPAVVAAAAGSGKTTVTVERAARLVEAGVPPDRIVSLAFNKDAAEQIGKRLRARLGRGRVPVCSTFHAFGLAAIREAFPDDPRVVSGKIATTLAPAVKAAKHAGLKRDVEHLMAAYRLAREDLVRFEDPKAEGRIARLFPSASAEMRADILAFCLAYEEVKLEAGVIDFADMLAWAARDVLDGGRIHALLLGRYDHVQVDECQDASKARYVLSDHIARQAHSYVLVGDPAQSINGFAGARPDLFQTRARTYRLLSMPVNRRSTHQIVETGNRLVRGYSWRVGGDAQAVEGRVGPEPAYWRSVNDRAEASRVGALVAREVAAGYPLADEQGRARYACLARTHAQLAVVELELASRGIPTRSTGDGTWAAGDGAAFMSYLRLVHGRYTRATLGGLLKAVANRPRRMLPHRDLERLDLESGVLGALRRIGTPACRSLAGDLSRIAEEATWEDRVHAVRDVLDRGAGGLADAVEADADGHALVDGLASAALQAGSIEALERLARPAGKAGEPAVVLSTIHAAKGLEWETVFVLGVSAGVLPHKRAAGAEGLEEERRLLYVGVTRACERLVVSASGVPSTLFEELAGAARAQGRPGR